MNPTNPNVDAIVFALSLIADESDAKFPRELTLSATTRMLETLRGAAKRSSLARAMGFLCASLAKSSVFHAGICTEHNLSILSKLLVGGSNDVLCAAAYALGVIATYGNDRVKHSLFSVDAPHNLLQLITNPASSSKHSTAVRGIVFDADTITQCAMFALGSVTIESSLLESGKHVKPTLSITETLHDDLYDFCGKITDSGLVQYAFDLAILSRQQIGSTYALKLLTAVSYCDDVKRLIRTPEGVSQLMVYLKCADSCFLGCVLMALLENCIISSVPSRRSSFSKDASEYKVLQHQVTDIGTNFSKLVETSGDVDKILLGVLQQHPPEELLGFPDVLSLFVINSPDLKTRLSSHAIVDSVLSVAARVNHLILHAQIVVLLNNLTAHKNQVAVLSLFKAGPDRVANILQSSMSSHVQFTAATVLRRMFKRLNAEDIPGAPALRHLSRLLTKSSTDASNKADVFDKNVALVACRVWGNLVQHADKRLTFAKSPDAVEGVLNLLHICLAQQTLENNADSTETDTGKPTNLDAKNLYWIVRTLFRAVQSDEVKQVFATSPSFFAIVNLFSHSSCSIVRLAILTVSEIAKVSALRKFVVVPIVLETVLQIVRDRDPLPASLVSKLYSLRLLAIVAKKDKSIQQILVEAKILDSLLVLLHSPMTSLNWELMKECLETLAWMSSGQESPCRRIVSTAKVVDFTLRHIDSAREDVAVASLHLLQRLSLEESVQNIVQNANGAAVIMRAIQARLETETKRRACALIRNLVNQHDGNRKQFQVLGVCGFLVTLIARVHTELASNSDNELASALLHLGISGLKALGALCESTSNSAKTCKREVVESDSAPTVLTMITPTSDKTLTAAWCHTFAMVVHGSPTNQKCLIDFGLVALLVQLLRTSEKTHQINRVRVSTAQLMAYLAVQPDKRGQILKEGGENLFTAIVAALQSDIHDLHRYTALLIANLTTRNIENKVKLGASGVISPLTDRLSSKQLNVIENVLSAISKLGSHAGNKVKFGSKVCFEKLISLVHHDELTIRKNAVATIAVLVEGNETNKKYLLQCEVSVITELCALMKASNGKIVESAMLILGELSLLQEHTLEISKFIDIVAVVRMTEHINTKIRRAALSTVLNLTKESFNKVRFGIKECIDALIACLVSDDLIIVELAITCLGNLSFSPGNTSLIAQHSSSLILLLKLAAASTTSKDYLSWNESRTLRLAKSPSKAGVTDDSGSPSSNNTGRLSEETEINYSEAEDIWQEILDPQGDGDRALVYTYRKTDEENEDEDQQVEILDFSSFPSRQTTVLEQTLLILSNCAEEYHSRNRIEKVAVKVICQALSHNSELVKRCACYTLACWCKKHPGNQETASRRGVLPILIQLLNSPSLQIIEAAMYALAKLCYYGDNHVKMLNLDILATLLQGLLRRQSNMTHISLLDRATRLLGTLVQFPKVRQVIKPEEIIAETLTQIIQLHRTVLAKNVSRLILTMLLEDSLKFFMPKKTVMLLRAIYADRDASPKTIRNILLIFNHIANVEEHKITIALEDSGETIGQIVAELHVECEQHEDMLRIPELPPNAKTLLSIMAVLSSSRKVAVILHEKHVYAALPRYLVPHSPAVIEQQQDFPTPSGQVDVSPSDWLGMNFDAVLIVKHMCKYLDERAIRQLSALEISRVLVNIMRLELSKISILSDEVLHPQLSTVAYECLVVLQQMCSSPQDEHILFQEGAIEIFLRYLQTWHNLVESRKGESVLDPADTAGIVAMEEFINPLSLAVLGMARGQLQNRHLLVDQGGIPLLIVALGVDFLPDKVREQLAVALSCITPIPIASKVYEDGDIVSPIVKFMIQHHDNSHLLLLSLQILVDMFELAPSCRKYALATGTLGLTFLVDCLLPSPKHDDEINSSRLRYAINALECVSTEPDVAKALATLPNLAQVSQLLLLSAKEEHYDIQLFATEMMGYMAFFGHADKLHLNKSVIEKMLWFCDCRRNALVTAPSITLCSWTLAFLVKSEVLDNQVTDWIIEITNGIDILLDCAFFAPENITISSAVISHVLVIVLAAIERSDKIPLLLSLKSSFCSALSAKLEAVETDIRLPALHVLAIMLLQTSQNISSSSEQWSEILRNVMEWMQVFAQDPSTCPTAAILDAYIVLDYLTTHPSVEADFKGHVARSGLIDTVANTLLFFGARKLPSRPEHMILLRRESGQSGANVAADQACVDWKYQFSILLHALRVLNNLTAFAAVYSSRILQLRVPQVIENLLHLRESGILTETLRCMNYLTTLSLDNSLLFSSDQCVTQLKSLLLSEKPAIRAQITPLFVRMADSMPTLPGLSSIDGVNIISDLVGVCSNWNERSDYERQITDDCCSILLSLFSANEQLFVNYDIAQTIPKLFHIIERDDMPQLPLRVLVRISACPSSHIRFLELLPRICKLLGTSADNNKLDVVQLCRDATNLLLTILFNLYCEHGSLEASALSQRLQTSIDVLLPQLLPLRRWVDISRTQPQSVIMVIKILHGFMVGMPMQTLLNDGQNIPSLLSLVGSESEGVALTAAQLLFAASKEKEVQISVIVEDGIASLVRALCSVSTWELQCLVLTLLSSMSSDSEVQALLLAAPNCVGRLLEFINARTGVLLSADERLKSSCEILARLSSSPAGPQKIIEAEGHTCILELSAGQLSVKGDEPRVVAMQILANMAKAAASSPIVSTPLISAKLPDHFAKFVLGLRPASSGRYPVTKYSEKLALSGLRSMSETCTEVCSELSKNTGLVSLLETLMASKENELSVIMDSLAILYRLSKLSAGCLAISKHTSSLLLAHISNTVCNARASIYEKDSERLALAHLENSVDILQGVKLLANLLSDVSTLQAMWDISTLNPLSDILGFFLKNHEHPKRQLTALSILSGIFSRLTYFSISGDMLVDLLNIMLISPSQQHRVLVERILVAAFGDESKIRPSIVGCQILELLVIVFTQQSEPIEQRVLASALVVVIQEAISRGFIVNERFLYRLIGLLGILYSSRPHTGATDIVQRTTPIALLEIVLCEYLSFIYSFPPDKSTLPYDISATILSRSLCDAIQAESGAPALRSLTGQLMTIHSFICTSESNRAPQQPQLQNKIQFWNFFSGCAIASPILHGVKQAVFETEPELFNWACLITDWFAWIQADSSAPTKVEGVSSIPSGQRRDAIANTCRMVSLISATFNRVEEASEAKMRLASVPIAVVWVSIIQAANEVTVDSAALIECALQAVLDVGRAWGDTIILSTCDSVDYTSKAVVKMLAIFHIADQALAMPRHLLLELLLLLVSSNRFIEVLKAADIRSFIEANDLIAPKDKALPVTILSLLGYNADLNDEFKQALSRLVAADNDKLRQEHIKYIENFLQLYSVSDDDTLEYAINVFMRLLTTSVGTVLATHGQSEVSGIAASVEEDITSIQQMAILYLELLRRIATTRKFPELYLKKWRLSELFSVLFSRFPGHTSNGYKECSFFDVSAIVQALQTVISRICEQLDGDMELASIDPLEDLDLHVLHGIFTLVEEAAKFNDFNSGTLLNQILQLISWMLQASVRCFVDIYDYANRLCAFIPCATKWVTTSGEAQCSENISIWLTILEKIVNYIEGRTERLDELLLSILSFTYANIAVIPLHARDRLLLLTLVLLKRMGEQGRSGSASYEHATEQILSHIINPITTELQSRCSYDLLGVLTQLDPAITVLYNMDGIARLLHECGCSGENSTSAPGSATQASSDRRGSSTLDSWRSTKRGATYCQTEALKCLSQAARTHDEVVIKIGGAPGISAFLFRALSKGLEPVPIHPGSGVGFDAQSSQIVSTPGSMVAHNRHESTQEHAAHLIARISAQEYLRAALLSQEHVAILIESLESVHLAVVLASLEALRYLCEFSMCLDALVRHATVPVLAQILFSPGLAVSGEQNDSSHLRTAFCVMRLLGEMCAKSKLVCRRVVSSHLVPKLKEFVITRPKSSSGKRVGKVSLEHELQHDAVWVVKSLSKDTELVLKVIDQGMVEAICSQLSRLDPVATQPKALSALRNIVSVPGAVSDGILQLLIEATTNVIRKNIPVPTFQCSVAKSLRVFIAVASLHAYETQQTQSHLRQAQEVWSSLSGPKQLLLAGNAVQMALDLLKSHDSNVRLQAFTLLFNFAEGNNDPSVIRDLIVSEASTTTGTKTTTPPLVSIIRAISEESKITSVASSSALLLVALMLLNVLLTDDMLIGKLTPMAFEATLQVLFSVPGSHSSSVASQLSTHQHKVLVEALKALATMTKAGGIAHSEFTSIATSPSSPLYKSIEPLVHLVYSGSGSLRLNVLFLLVNFASTPEIRKRIWELEGLQALVDVLVSAVAAPDHGGNDKVIQLCLLGAALLTSSDDWVRAISESDTLSITEKLASSIDPIVGLLKSKNLSVQANAVWVVSNLSTVGAYLM